MTSLPDYENKIFFYSLLLPNNIMFQEKLQLDVKNIKEKTITRIIIEILQEILTKVFFYDLRKHIRYKEDMKHFQRSSLLLRSRY